MESESSNQAGDLLEIIFGLVDVLFAMLSRPVVLRQILAVMLILLFAWLIPEGIRRYRRRRGLTGELGDDLVSTRGKAWLVALVKLATPVAALILLYLSILLFARLGYPNGLLQDLTNVIWLWLAYRAVQTLLYSRYGDAARPYERRIVTPIFVLLVAFQVVATLPGAVSVAEVAIRLGSLSFTIAGITGAFIVFYLFAVIAWVTQRVMEHSLPARLKAEPGVIESIATLIRYSLLAIGLIVSLGILGLDLTSLAIIAGGLSVGIGIGLQDIVSNFVSGLVLLFEQSLRPGDVIEFGGRLSQVEKISLRATTVRTRTNVEVIIPNASFTTAEVQNLTKSERLVRIAVPLGVGYDSEPEEVRQIAVETAAQHHLVLADPPPALLFRGYGESSLDFELSVSINQPELTILIQSDLYYALWEALKTNNIEIPFPQRDLNLGAGWDRLAPQVGAN